MDLPSGPWIGLWVVCFNVLLISCDEARLPGVDSRAESLPNIVVQPFYNSKDTGKIAESSDVEARPISKRRVVSRKGVPQSSTSSYESAVTQAINITSQGNYSSDIWNNTAVSSQTNTSSDSLNSEKNVSMMKPVENAVADPSVKSSLSLGTKVSVVTPQNVSAVTTPLSTVVTRKKGKPGVTFDVDDLPKDKNGNIVVSSTDVVSSEPAVDFVVPVVIALLALPFVAVLGTFLFKKGRDFWDRRHYRRMDFLIEGMYNE